MTQPKVQGFQVGTLEESNVRDVVPILRSDNVVNPKFTGGVFDGVTDDTVAIQTAIDEFETITGELHGGTVLLPGPTVISDTLLIDRKSINLQGFGWGNDASVIYWDGPGGSPGIPMIRVRDSRLTTLRDFRMFGNTTNLPSAAISFEETGTLPTQQNNRVERVYIGDIVTDPNATGTGTISGIVVEGVNNNNAESLLYDVFVGGVTDYGVDFQEQQFVDWQLTKLGVVGCGIAGVRFAAGGPFEASMMVCSGNAVDLLFDGSNTRLSVNGFFSEGSARFIEFAGSADVAFRSGRWSGISLHADGRSIILTKTVSAGLQMDGFSLDGDVYMPTPSTVHHHLAFRNMGKPEVLTSSSLGGAPGPVGTASTMTIIQEGGSGQPGKKLTNLVRDTSNGGDGTPDPDAHDIGSANVRLGNRVIGSAEGSTNLRQATAHETISAGSTHTFTGLVPANAIVLGVTIKVRGTIGGAATMDIGDGSDVDKWGAAISTTSGTSTDMSDFTITSIPYFTATGEDVVLTAIGSPDFDGTGDVRVMVSYIDLSPPMGGGSAP